MSFQEEEKKTALRCLVSFDNNAWEGSPFYLSLFSTT